MSKKEESQSSYYVKSGLFSFFEKGSVFVFGFLGFALLARLLTKENWGTWVLFMAVAATFEIGILGLIQNGLVKYLSKAKESDYGKIILASGTLYLIVTILSAIFIFFAAPVLGEFWQAEKLTQLFQMFAVLLFALMPFSFFNFLQQANLNFEGIFWSNFVRKGLFFCFVLYSFIIQVPPELDILVWVQVISAIVAGITSYRFGKKYFRIEDFKIDWSWVQELFRYGKFTFGTNLSTMLYKSIDKFMLGRFINPVAVGLYDAAIKITNLVDVPAVSVASVVFPQSAIQADEDTAAVKALYEKSVGVTLAVILPFITVVMLVPELILWITTGEKYLEAAPILRLTVLYGLFLPFAIQFGTILDSIGKPKINFAFTLIGMALNVLLNYIFIKVLDMGIYGAAYGTLLTYFLTFLMYQTVLNRMFKVNALNAFSYIPGFYKQAWEMVKAKLR